MLPFYHNAVNAFLNSIWKELFYTWKITLPSSWYWSYPDRHSWMSLRSTVDPSLLILCILWLFLLTPHSLLKMYKPQCLDYDAMRVFLWTKSAMLFLPKLQKSRRFAHQISYKNVLSNSSSLIVAMSISKLELFSRGPRLFKRVCPSDHPLVGW